MRVAVLGMWHLGTVIAACLASVGHSVLGFDEDPETTRTLQTAGLPVAEPGLKELIAAGQQSGNLSFSSDAQDLRDAEVLWIAYDTPVDDSDRADVESVVGKLRAIFPKVRADALIVISSQIPVGSTRHLEGLFRSARPDADVRFAYSPENLRLGKALQVFLQPDRMVVGTSDSVTKQRVAALLAPVTDKIEWTGIESAEMTKHALNAFLATSITFINEIAGLCERVGADAAEVARALKSDVRIGPRAYLQPGTAFAGGTLARDLSFLAEIGAKVGRSTLLISSVVTSNAAHRRWPITRIRELLPALSSQRVAVLGLTYKPGTDTLRRSTAVEMCRELNQLGARVAGYDPALRSLPPEVSGVVEFCVSPERALRGAVAALIGTDCPEFRSIGAEDIVAWMKQPLVLDPGGFLEGSLGKDTRIRYVKVGRQFETTG